jgi:UPF0716 family protein affecting phage T7 exclusion
MPVLTAASNFAEGGGRPELFDISLSTFSLIIAGGILMVIGFITIMVGTMIAVRDSRKGRRQKEKPAPSPPPSADTSQQKEKPAPSAADTGTTITGADPRNPYNDPTLPYYNPDLDKK